MWVRATRRLNGATFVAVSFDGNTAVSVVERPGPPPGEGSIRGTITGQFDVVGDVQQDAMPLPGGHADRYTFTATANGATVNGRWYTFTHRHYSYSVIGATTGDQADPAPTRRGGVAFPLHARPLGLASSG